MDPRLTDLLAAIAPMARVDAGELDPADARNLPTVRDIPDPVYDLLLRLLGGRHEDAIRWLTAPNPGLDGMRPGIAALDPDGAERVHNLLVALAYGDVT